MQAPLSLRILSAGIALAATGAVLSVAGAQAAERVRPADARASLASLRALVDHYRVVTWNYQRAGRVPRTRTSYSYRRSPDRAYLRWTIDQWTRRAYRARDQALARIRRKLAVRLPPPPALRAPLLRRLTYSRRLTVRLRRIYPGSVTQSFIDDRASSDRATLRLWQVRGSAAALAVAVQAPPPPSPRPSSRPSPQPALPAFLVQGLLCIHGLEGAWDANTGNGYYGGLQMDWGFMRAYGGEFVAQWGSADNWPVAAQLQAAARAYSSGRGFSPWPSTARACGLL